MQTVNIATEIKKLVKLQEIDTQLYSLNREKEEKPKILERLQSEFEQKKQILKENEEKSKALLLKRKDKEGQLAVKEEDIKKLQAKLYTLKTNKEYSALLTEINGVKMDKSLLEEEILKMFDEQDGLRQELEKLQIVVKEEEGKFNEEKQKILSRVKEIEAQIADLESKRAVAEKEVDARILSQYNRIIKGKESLALVKVVNDSCQGCYMNVPPQVINEIKMNDKLIFCEMCARILYIPDEPTT
ncbi:MAG: C4-type zinc ribbon domain-containing protein [Candidatus Omnitrophica bacterium]|nr:C4-type zinc ribbon domain-containing protein [Candidatus Omnitrophota bacterium]MDD5352333.1 C4-type zinc ribbon domain-containing protein [Candidatus Omnitrophota bacterium]MDD5549931.1 C4-type zinc ribbon domain-containing protein [Candidatus Omnitrophota bacterium]